MVSPQIDRSWRARAIGTSWFAVGLCAVAMGQEPTSSKPASEETISPAELLERLRKMEKMNQELLEKVGKLTEQNEKLSKQYDELSKKVEESSKKGKKGQPEAKKESGLAGPGGFQPIPEPSLDPYDVEPRGSGANLMPYAQGEGNRHLGKIPLKSYFDYGREGVGFATDDDEFSLKLRTELQADSLYYTKDGDPTHSGFYLPRTRFYFQGHYTRPISYQLSFQRSYTTFGFLNVFLNFNYDPRFQFKIGRFKVPFTYEWYKINNWRLITPERSLFATNFGLSRMVGAMWWGELYRRRLEYAVGIFNGGRNSIQDFNDSKDIAAFLNFRPFAHRKDFFLENLNFGGSVDYGNQNNPADPAVLRTNVNASSELLSTESEPINNATVPFLAFNNDIREKGNRELWELHLAYFYQGLSLIGAWGSGFDSFGPRDSRSVPLAVEGYYISVAYLITGETLNERVLIDPIRRFDLREGKFGVGAFEPFFRYSELGISRNVFTDGLADPNLWTDHVRMTDLGLNWYLNRAVKIYFDWEHALFGQPVYYKPGGLQTTSNLFWVRFQFYF
jgi:phosphate-selective porin OprO/OprP